MDFCPPGFSVLRILQARISEFLRILEILFLRKECHFLLGNVRHNKMVVVKPISFEVIFKKQQINKEIY